jgi:hypothetical protein
MNNKIQVYTSITGNFDRNLNNKDVLFFNHYNRFKHHKLNAKIYKAMPHLFLDSEYSIWIDGNVQLNCDPHRLVDMMNGKDLLVFKQPDRDCLYEEAKACIKLELDNERVINEQIDRYLKQGWPKNAGLGSCRLIVRKNTKNMNNLNATWWSEICRGSMRDQISFPFVYRNSVQYIDHPNSYDNEFFKIFPHKITLLNKVKFKLTGNFR